MEVRPGEVVGLIGPNGGEDDAHRRSDRLRPIGGRSRSTVVPSTGGTRRAGTPRAATLVPVARAVRGRQRRGQHPCRQRPAGPASWATDLVWPRHHDLPSTAVAAVHEFDLEPHLDDLPDELPYGRRRLVGIARTVASGPSVVMLDKPAAGLDEHETGALAADPSTRRRAQHGGAPRRARHEPRDVDVRSHRRHRLRPRDRERPPDEIRSDPAVRVAYSATGRGRTR